MDQLHDYAAVHVAEHLSTASIDPVGYALVTDADGPASPNRIDRAGCLQASHEGVNPGTGLIDFLAYAARAG